MDLFKLVALSNDMRYMTETPFFFPRSQRRTTSANLRHWPGPYKKLALCVMTGSDICCRVTSTHARDHVGAEGGIGNTNCSNITSARSSLALTPRQDDSAAANQKAVLIQSPAKSNTPVARDRSAAIEALSPPVTPMRGEDSQAAVEKQAKSVEHWGGGKGGCSVAGATCSSAASPTREENPLREVKQALFARRADSRTSGVAKERSTQGEDSPSAPTREAPFVERIRSGTRYSSAASERCGPVHGSSIEDAGVAADTKASFVQSTSSVQPSTIVRGASGSHEQCGKTASLSTDDVQVAADKPPPRTAEGGKGTHACPASGARCSPAASLSQEDARRAVNQASFEEPGGSSSRGCCSAAIEAFSPPVTPMQGEDSQAAVEKQAKSVEHWGGGTSGCSVAGEVCGRNVTSMQEDGHAASDTAAAMLIPPQTRNSARGGCPQPPATGEGQAGNAASSADKVRSPSQADRVQGHLGPPNVKNAACAQVASSTPSGQDFSCWRCAFAGEIVVNTLPPKDRSYLETKCLI